MRIKRESVNRIEGKRGKTAMNQLDFNFKAGAREGAGHAPVRAEGQACTLIEMTGQRCGRLTVMARAGKDSKGQATWRCVCDCGNEITAAGSRLRAGSPSSCGCLRVERAGRRRIDMAGRRFGSWTALCPAADRISGHAAWKCRCDCGKVRVLSGDGLRRGNSRSCGCLRAKSRDYAP